MEQKKYSYKCDQPFVFKLFTIRNENEKGEEKRQGNQE